MRKSFLGILFSIVLFFAAVLCNLDLSSLPAYAESTSWTSSVSNITYTNATVSARVDVSERENFQWAGCNFFDANGNLIAQAGEVTSVSGTYLNIWYDINSETGNKLVLSPGTKYKYQFYVTYNNIDHFGPMCEFTTLSNSTPSSGTTTQYDVSVNYKTHVQSYGWQNFVKNGTTSGTLGKSKRVEALQIKLENNGYGGGITYRAYIQKQGWQGWKSNGVSAGTSGKGLRIEAIQVKLTGNVQKYYDVYYRTYAQKYGWLGWTKNGSDSGTKGFSYRLEAIQIKLVKKGNAAPTGTSMKACYDISKVPVISYTTHVQNYGWQKEVTNGKVSGTVGKAKRLEGIKIYISKNQSGTSGGISYKTHIQKLGWESEFKSNGAISGTVGKKLRLEAIQIKLTGNLANEFDIYYRTHAQKFGWLGWAKNGAISGTSGYGFRLEGIQIEVKYKGDSAPGSEKNAYRKLDDFYLYLKNNLIPKYGISKNNQFSGVMTSENAYKINWLYPNGILSAKVYDFDCDGKNEMMVLRMDKKYSREIDGYYYNLVAEIYEKENTGIVLKASKVNLYGTCNDEVLYEKINYDVYFNSYIVKKNNYPYIIFEYKDIGHYFSDGDGIIIFILKYDGSNFVEVWKHSIGEYVATIAELETYDEFVQWFKNIGFNVSKDNISWKINNPNECIITNDKERILNFSSSDINGGKGYSNGKDVIFKYRYTDYTKFSNVLNGG